jgi:glycosyltransferase involved in cell wall biosynthesis
MVVQPSMYEGFGYPVAEAMSCGAAVIAAETSSVPEITGAAAVMIPPTDPKILAAAIVRLAREPELRKRLKRRALERAPLFQDPRNLAATTLDAYRGAVGRAAAPGNARPRVAVWSSMPPKDCGVADYAYELANKLADTHDVDVYVDGKYEPTQPESRNVKFRHPHDYGIDGKPVSTIFQMGARKDYQDYMYPYIRKHGGSMVVHDISMAIAFYYIARWAGSLNEFEDEVVLPEGLEVLDAYTRLEANCAEPPHDVLVEFFKRRKMLQWLINHSDRVLVHTDPLRKRFLDEYPAANIGVVRMGVTDRLPPMRHLPRVALLAALGVAAPGLCIGSFGIMDRVKRIEVVIESFVRLCESYPASLLLLVGSWYDAGYRRELKSRARASGVEQRIIMLEYVSPAAFQSLMALTDVVVNLRSPDRLGLSAVLLRALAAAKPVITSDIEEWRIFPKGVCLAISKGDREVEELTGHFIRLASDRSAMAELGRAARRWFLANGTLSAMADDYMAQMRCVEAFTKNQD